MNRQQKETAIADLKQMLAASQGTFLVNYKGMNVPLLQDLRKSLRTDGGTLKVTKATLMRLAAKDLPGADSFEVRLEKAGRNISRQLGSMD